MEKIIQKLRIVNSSKSELIVIVEPYVLYESFSQSRALDVLFVYESEEIETVEYSIEYGIGQITINILNDLSSLNAIQVELLLVN